MAMVAAKWKEGKSIKQLRQGMHGPGRSYQEAQAMHTRVQQATAALLADLPFHPRV
jgi:hypothetical protein